MEKVRIITINLWEDWSKVKQYAKDNSCLFLRDGTGSVWNAYKQNGYIPLNYVLETDTNHTVHGWAEGFNETQIKTWINECLPGVEENVICKGQNPKLEVYPNPFTQKTEIKFQISDTRYQNPDIRHPTSDISLKIYDLTGRLVRTLIANPLSLIPVVEWDGKDNKGMQVPPGVYFCKLTAEKVNLIEKLIVAR